MAKKRKKQPFVPVQRPTVVDEPKSVAEDINTLWRLVIPFSGIMLILISGVLHGIQTNRWTDSNELQDAAARLNDIPEEVGDWKSVKKEIPEDQLKQAGAAGYFVRNYTNTVTNEVVQVMILCGHHGPISLHPPTVCFTSAGWKVTKIKKSEIKSLKSDSSVGEFNEAIFQRQSLTGVRTMKTYWAWNSDGKWKAPNNPRFEFAGKPYLFKVYFSTILDDKVGKTGDKTKAKPSDAANRFAQEFLAVLKKHNI